MITTEIHVESAQPVQPSPGRPDTTLLAVVGFDGSAPSLAALEAATELIRGRNGHLEIVYVEHLPASVGMSAPAIVGMRESLDAIADELNGTARITLDDREPRWHFQRRDGSVTHELAAAATELRRQHGPAATIVIVVGASAHLAHHVAGSVAVALARDAGFPLLVVPTASVVLHPSVETRDSAAHLG